MAGTIYEEITDISQVAPFIGHQILDIITSGMYDDPLMIYREYIQNAVDSVDVAVQKKRLRPGEERISVQISGLNRTVSIEDEGDGLSETKARRVLLDIGYSPKDGLGQRGFRGIGRLGGLAYCDLLRFETRSSGLEKVTVVEWNKKRLDDLTGHVNRDTSLVSIVADVTRIFTRKATEKDPPHFFRTEMINVRSFHSDRLMDIKKIKEYLSQVAPVPYDIAQFRFAAQLDKYVSTSWAFKGYNITLNGEKILRPYSDRIQISDNVTDDILDIKCFEFSTTDAKPLALGWYAKTNFKASLPSHVTMRGIRVRYGNLAVGDEYFLSPFFTERRFVTWNIGEIHLCDRRVRLNARRDGFEQTVEYERFLEQASFLGRRLSILCRNYSIERSQKQKTEKRLEGIKQLLNNSYLFVDKEHYASLTKTVRQELDKLLPSIKHKGANDDVLVKYKNVETALNKVLRTPSFVAECLDGRSFRHASSRDVTQTLAKLILNEYDKSVSANDLIQRVLAPFLKSSAKRPFNTET